MSNPQLIISTPSMGIHNADLDESAQRIQDGGGYRDQSTICIIPTRGMIPARVVESWMSLMTPMNQKFMRIMMQGYEVGVAYERAIQAILDHPELSTWKYVLTMEEDNIPPPDGLIRLLENIERYPAGLGGLYWTKGPAGQPMIYGDPNEAINFRPQVPQKDTIQRCNGLGMGFTLYRLDVFRDQRFERPFFRTVQDWDPNSGAALGTQDLHFFEKARQLGYEVACDTRVRVGHYDAATDTIW